MKKITVLALIVISFLAGSISSASIANATQGSHSPFDSILNSIKNLNQKNNSLQNQINALQNQVNKLNSEVATLLPLSPPPTNKVDISTGAGASANAACVSANSCFNPGNILVKSGGQITWTNTDAVSHTVTSGKVSDDNAGSLFDSGLVKTGSTFQFTFANVGTYNYFCTVHPWMTGIVTVK